MGGVAARIVGHFSLPLFGSFARSGVSIPKLKHRYQKRLLLVLAIASPSITLFIRSTFPLQSVFQLWLGLVLVRLVQQRQMTHCLLFVESFVGVATLFLDYHFTMALGLSAI